MQQKNVIGLIVDFHLIIANKCYCWEDFIRIGITYCIWVSEWLLFNANSAIAQLYFDENKFIFNEMTMTIVFEVLPT